LAYNLVTAFERTWLPESWQHFTLQKLRLKVFLLPSELTRPRNRSTLRLKDSALIQRLVDDILARIARLGPPLIRQLESAFSRRIQVIHTKANPCR
jgi:hypothetical protein